MIGGNPFNFQHFNLSEMALYLDGQQEYALKPLQLDFDNNLYIRAYNALFACTCKLNQDEGNCISRIDFANGYAPFSYDLTANLTDDSHFNLVKTGSVRLALKFSAALAATVWTFNAKKLQSIIRRVCAHYCIYYIVLKKQRFYYD